MAGDETIARVGSEAGGNAPGSGVARGVARRALVGREEAYVQEAERLLDAGLTVMRRCGVDSSPRVADIVAEAGLSNDAFYRYFASKEDLVLAIVEAGAHRLAGYLRHRMAKSDDPVEQIEAWITGVMNQALDPDVAGPTRAVLWNSRQTNGDRQRRAIETTAELAALLIEPVSRLGRADPIRSAGVVARAVMGTMNDFLWRSEQPVQADVDHLVAFCIGGLGVEKRN